MQGMEHGIGDRDLFAVTWSFFFLLVFYWRRCYLELWFSINWFQLILEMMTICYNDIMLVLISFFFVVAATCCFWHFNINYFVDHPVFILGLFCLRAVVVVF